MLALMRAAIVVQDYAEVTHVVQSMQSSSASTLYALCVLLPWFLSFQTLLPKMLHPPMRVSEGGLWNDPWYTRRRPAELLSLIRPARRQ